MGYLNEGASWDVGVPYFEANAILTGGPDCPDNIPIQALANRTVFLKKQIDDAVSGALTVMYANRLKTASAITMTGDGSWAVSFDGNGNVTAAMTLANSGVGAGTYRSVTVDAKGRVTGGTNPTTLAGYGITDALLAANYTAADVLTKIKTVDGAASGLDADLLDGQEGAYYLSWGNFTGKPTTLAGYGITDAVTKDGQGNVGIGVVPKTWDVIFPVIQMNAKTAIAADLNSTYYGTNWYRSAGVYKRLGSGHALMYHQDSAAGRHLWKTAASDVADSNVAWSTAMSLDAATGVLDVPAGITTATQAAGDSSTKAANTAFVQAAITSLVGASAFTGSNQSLSTNGYQKLPGGLILQWGYYSGSLDDLTALINFNIAFPNTCLNVTSTADGGQSSSSNFVGVAAQKVSTTQFRINGQGGGLATNGYHWFAIGN